MILEINQKHPEPRKIRQVVEVLANGGIIAYPTDTFYGIGCDLLNKASIEKIYLLKRRPKHQPFSFICSDLKNISEYAQVTNYAYKTMRRLLPGPYTFVLEGSRMVPRIMLTKRQTVGIRVPDHPICLAIVEALGHPIISTSATAPKRRNPVDPAWNPGQNRPRDQSYRGRGNCSRCSIEHHFPHRRYSGNPARRRRRPLNLQSAKQTSSLKPGSGSFPRPAGLFFHSRISLLVGTQIDKRGYHGTNG